MSNDNKYQMVRSPATWSQLGAERATFYLGKSEKGVYSALLYWVDYGRCPQFRVWFLKEEEEEEENDHIHMEWVLKTNISLPPLLANRRPLLHSGFADDEWRVIRDYNNKEEVPPAAAHGDDEFADDELMMMNGTLTMLTLSSMKPKIISSLKQTGTTLLISSDFILTKRLSSFAYHLGQYLII